MKYLFVSIALFVAPHLFGQPAGCDMDKYAPQDGLAAKATAQGVEFTWTGKHQQEMRASFAIENGQPKITSLSVRKSGGAWIQLAGNLTPEYEVTTGKRRMSEQQLQPLRKLNVPITKDLLDREKWNAFWDAPLEIPGRPGTNADLPRKPEEVRRAHASFHIAGCAVKTDGSRLQVTFPGVQLGIFSGNLQYTVYRGTNLLRQEVIAKTEEPSVAYKYDAGLNGFEVGKETRVVWRDVARNWQQYAFGADTNKDSVPLVARNRLAILETGAGSLGFFPPPHKFFFAREIETNLGFVYYRKDSENSFAIGARQAEHEQGYRPYGISDAEWKRRADESRHDVHNFALYNAPPGTWQHMPVYFYLSVEDSKATADSILAFTHDDRYKELPGFKVMASHFHMHFNEQLSDAGTIDLQPSWYSVFRGLGINIVILADFHSDSHPNDPGPVRFKEQKVYFEGCRRFSDKDFLLIPGEEPDANLGGHYMFLLPHTLYWSHVQAQGQTFSQNDPDYGHVYHVNSAADELSLLNAEHGLMWQTHPRTKGSAGYPDAVRHAEHFTSDRFLGGSYQSLPVDQSEARLCESRCLGLLDDMNNWAGPKFMLAEGDTYMKYPDDETYPQLAINYVKLDRVPAFKDGWMPLLETLRAGNYFVSTGEVLFRNWAITGSGVNRAYEADVEWTYPLDFIELVWGDGKTTKSQVIRTADSAAFGHSHFKIPFDPAGKKWVRFAAWDSAGNGAFTQPTHLQ